MDLRDRRRRQRRLVELRERALREILRHDAANVFERNRRDLVDELPELLDVDVREQVRPRRQQLAELHVGRPELLERASELPCALRGRRPPSGDSDLA